MSWDQDLFEDAWQTAQRLGGIPLLTFTYLRRSIVTSPDPEFLERAEEAEVEGEEEIEVLDEESGFTIENVFAPKDDGWDPLREAVRDCMRFAWQEGYEAGPGAPNPYG